MKPQRMCTVCRRLLPRDELWRIAKTNDGFFIDFENKIISRGAYICKNNDCLSKARKKNAFERSFSCKVSHEVYDILEGLVNNYE